MINPRYSHSPPPSAFSTNPVDPQPSLKRTRSSSEPDGSELEKKGNKLRKTGRESNTQRELNKLLDSTREDAGFSQKDSAPVDSMAIQNTVSQGDESFDLLMRHPDIFALACQPEQITKRLVDDPEFQNAYIQFIDQLIHLGNASVTIEKMEELQHANELASQEKNRHEDEWQKTIYSSALAALTRVENPTITLANHHIASDSNYDSVEDALIDEMKKTPEKPIFWSINGNNHFPTHQGLIPILEKMSYARQDMADGKKPNIKDIILISGNAAGKSPFNAGPVGKYTTDNGEIVGELSEAKAIQSMLMGNPVIAENFEFILEEESKNTRENIANTARELTKRNSNLADFIVANSQSGLSGIRSGLISMGWQNNQNLPQNIYLVNPDMEPKDSVHASDYQLTGQTFIQAMREFMNITADISREFFIPPVPISAEIIDNFKICLRKINIDPDKIHSHEAQMILRSMQEHAMKPNMEKLIAPQKGYEVTVEAHLNKSKELRKKQDIAKKIINNYRNK